MDKEFSKEGKTLIAIGRNTIREIVSYAVEEKVQREDIVTILPERGQFVLLY